MNKHPHLFWPLLVCLFLVAACKDDSKKAPLPNSPEEVVLAWQKAIDKNEFDKARALSIEQALEHVNFMDNIMEEEGMPLEEDENTMLNLDCKVVADGRMRCEYVFEIEPESVEQVPRHLYLKKDNGQWKVQWVDDLEAMDWPQEDDMEDLLFPPEDSLE